MTNVPGYWKYIVDHPGIQSRSLEKRFFAPTAGDWADEFGDVLDNSVTYDQSFYFEQDLTKVYVWDTVETCIVDGYDFIEGFGAYVQGAITSDILYGVTFIVGVTPSFPSY